MIHNIKYNSILYRYKEVRQPFTIGLFDIIVKNPTNPFEKPELNELLNENGVLRTRCEHENYNEETKSYKKPK